MVKAIATFAAVLGFAVTALPQNMTDQQFVDKAAQVNMTEAHMGQLAQQKSTNPDVKQYGQRIAADHTDAYQKLSAMQGFLVPKGIDAQHQKAIRPFQRASGARFDREFKEMMIQDHQKAIDMFEKAQNQLTNQDLKNYIAQQLPILRDHLQRARDLSLNETTSRRR